MADLIIQWQIFRTAPVLPITGLFAGSGVKGMQFVFSVIAAICCILLLLAGVKVLPQLQEAVLQAETVLTNLETVTTDLAQADLIGMVENVDALVTNVDGLVGTSQEGVEQTMAKINAIDFDALNDAIKDLSDVIEPIAKFFNTFKFK